MRSHPEKKGLVAFVLGGIIHAFQAFGYSVEGLWAAGRGCLAFQQEALAFLGLCLALAFWSKPPGIWLLCLGCWSVVMILELVNTAIEKVLDLLTMERSPHVKEAKDMASAAVFISVLGNAALWLYVFGADILHLFRIF